MVKLSDLNNLFKGSWLVLFATNVKGTVRLWKFEKVLPSVYLYVK
jgi:hypothetical protein